MTQNTIKPFKYKAIADIVVRPETEELRKAVAGIIQLPEGKEKQPDLMYFSAVYVSSGGNLNYAYFLPTELVAAEHTIISKPMDIEHEESKIVGHIYSKVVTDGEGNSLDVKELASLDNITLNTKNIHIEIAGVIYKTRFPELAKEVAEGKWKVSMETFYNNYDVKIGDVIMSVAEAEAIGFKHEDSSLYGKQAKVYRDDKEVATGKIYRVLRSLCFSGCGFVKTPANPPSVVLEVSSNKNKNNNVTSVVIEPNDNIDNNQSGTAQSELQYKDGVGQCLNFRRWLDGSPDPKGPADKTATKTNWCTLYNKSCTSFSRDTTDPKCLRNIAREAAASIATELYDKNEKENRIDILLHQLSYSMNKAKNMQKGG